MTSKDWQREVTFVRAVTDLVECDVPPAIRVLVHLRRQDVVLVGCRFDERVPVGPLL